MVEYERTLHYLFVDIWRFFRIQLEAVPTLSFATPRGVEFFFCSRECFHVLVRLRPLLRFFPSVFRVTPAGAGRLGRGASVSVLCSVHTYTGDCA